MPIPISVQFSCFSTRKSIVFLIFDEDKNSNYARGFSMFEYFAGPLQDDIKELLNSANGEEVKCEITLEDTGMKGLGMAVKRLSPDRSIQVAK